jgi:(E)-4-hydroxy-3-methylbut-2-enyl-diphosphate synthase
VVNVGEVAVGGSNPIRVQSMTTSDTQDVEATVKQSIALAEVGCEIIRITAPNVAAAKCLQAIRRELSKAGFAKIPLVADIHFLPSAAMEAVEHVEKIRVNPGNYADKKKFNQREYTDADYDNELVRLHEAFSPLVLRCKELGRSMRIGTNHGSLSDRIMNRYGDTPLGMVESALEFLRIAESHSYHSIILSMKASNPKVMIEAYRLLVDRMQKEAMRYPLHLGVTEAGDGEDGRIKGAIGIGSLLLDGLGDTIRVSLTEDSVYEVPVARAIAEKAMHLWTQAKPLAIKPAATDSIDPFHFTKREVKPIELSPSCKISSELPPRIIVTLKPEDAGNLSHVFQSIRIADTPVEGLLFKVKSALAIREIKEKLSQGVEVIKPSFVLFEIPNTLELDELSSCFDKTTDSHKYGIVRCFDTKDADLLKNFASFANKQNLVLACDLNSDAATALRSTIREIKNTDLILTYSGQHLPQDYHNPGTYRALVESFKNLDLKLPIWIRNTEATSILNQTSFLSKLIEASILSGSLLCDGIGDLISIETEQEPARALKLCYNLLQGAGARISKTEFVACPSCGRTLFDLQTTTQRIRAQTGHLKGIKIAIMGCIVNGPGEMADADFGYVGGAPAKINLYVGKNCVQYNIPQAEADAKLIALIKEHGKWVEPPKA